MIVDSHCHLNYFSDEEIKNIIVAALESNIKIMQTVCTTISEFPRLLEIIRQNRSVYASVGIHPSNAEKGEYSTAQELVKYLSQDKKVIGLGETGLDLYRDNNNLDAQKKSFIAHIEASRETKIPLIIHSRNADEEMINILEEQMNLGEFSAVMHCFSSSKKLAEKALELGLYISFSGIITFRNARDIQEIATSIRRDRVLVETDSPFLSPEPYRGQKNKPVMTKYVVECLAKLWDTDFHEVSRITTENFFKLFSKCQKTE